MALFAVVQLVPGPNAENRRVVADHTLQAVAIVPPEVDAILRKACMDCHSNETRWPWYSRVAPFSWGVASDVIKARQTMNLSEWKTGPGKKPFTAVGFLAAMCADVRSGRMPPSKYRLLHPEAQLSEAEQRAMCAWTAEETARYLPPKRKLLVSEAGR